MGKQVIRRIGANSDMFHKPQSTSPAEDNAIEAVQGIGTNALPFILRQLALKTSASPIEMSPIEVFVRKLAVKFGIRLQNAFITRRQATSALLALVPLPPDAVSQLQTLSTNKPSNPSDERGPLAKYVLEMNAESQ